MMHSGLLRQRDLLMLTPCLPRPDGHASSRRWYHMLRFLARHFRVDLGCIADPAADGAGFSRVKALCHQTCFVAPPGLRQRVRAGTGQCDPVLASWAARLCQGQDQVVSAVLVCGARMGMYLDGLPKALVRVVDFVELESDQHRRHAASVQVLAAMALQKPVLGLPRSLSGLACLTLPKAYGAADASGFRARIAACLASPAGGLEVGSVGAAGPTAVGRAARARVLREHDWQLRLAGLPDLLAGARQPALGVA